MQTRKLIIVSFLCLFSASLNAQSFKFTSSEADTFQVDANEFDFTRFFYITNTSTDTLMISAERTSNLMAPGHSSFFCWDLCYDTTVDISGEPIVLPPGDTTRFQYITFVPGGFNGQSSASMRFFTADSSQGVLERSFHYRVVNGIAASNETAINVQMEVFPNPASHFLNVQFQTAKVYDDLAIQILDLQGKALYQQNLNNSISDFRISLDKFPAGVYQVVLLSEGQNLASKKLLIQD